MNPTTSSQALTSLQSAEKTAQDPNTILQQQQNQLGVNNAQQTVSGLRSAIDNTTKVLQQVAPSVMGRTANSLVTNAQANRQIQNEQAPISQNLTKQTGDYNNATTDLNNLEQKAQTAASGIYQGQQNKLSYAQNLYNTLFAKEQAATQQKDAAAAAARQQQQFNADLAERQREANMSRSASSNSGLGSVLGSLLGSSSVASAPKMTMDQGGGAHFYDTNGTPISAAKYAQLTNTPLGTILQKLGNSGDKYAAGVYTELAPTIAAGGKITQAIKKEYSRLFAGT